MEKQANRFVKAAKSKYSKAKRTFICRSLKDLIKAYRACSTAAEERALVKKEAAHIRDLFKQGDTTFRPRNIAKLLFFHMNGYPTDFGMTECIKLCASDKFSDKRVAYLGLMILVDETEDILMLMTNCLSQDLNNSDYNIVALALTVLGNVANADMLRDLLPTVEVLLEHNNAYIRKKAALVAVRTVRKLQAEETQNVLDIVPRLFEPRAHTQHLAAASLVVALAQQSSENLPQLQILTAPEVLNVLRDILLNSKRSGADDVINGVRSPFLQAKVLAALRAVCVGASESTADSVSDALAQVASNTDGTKLVGVAVLYECVRTINRLARDKALRDVGISILGKFLSHKDPNVRYIALQELVKTIRSGSVDLDISKYERTVLECLREPDPTIRLRALELLHSIASPVNVEAIAAEMLTFMGSAKEADLRESACRKLCDIVYAHSANVEWRFDTLLETLQITDTAMSESLVSTMLAMVSSEPSVQAYAARSVYAKVLKPLTVQSSGAESADPFDGVVALVDSAAKRGNAAEAGPKSSVKRKPRLERVAAYIFGEYGHTVLGPGEHPDSLDGNQALDALAALIASSTVDTVSFSATSMPIDPRDDDFAQEVAALRETALTAVLKIAARVAYAGGVGAQAQSVGTAPGVLGIGGTAGMLAIANGDDTAANGANSGAGALALVNKTQDTSALGTDLLASLGISDSPAPRKVENPRATDVAAFDAAMTNDDDFLMDGDEGQTHPILLRARRIVAPHRQSSDVETQQRACEYSMLLTGSMDAFRSHAFAPMPEMSYDAARRRMEQDNAAADGTSASNANVQAPFSDNLLSLLDDAEPNVPSRPALPPGDGLLGLPAPPNVGANSAPKGVGALTLDDLLGGHSGGEAAAPEPAPPSSLPVQAEKVSRIASTDPTPVPVPVPSMPIDEGATEQAADVDQAQPDEPVSKSFGSATIFDSDALKITAQFVKEDMKQAETTRADFVFSNKTESDLTGFALELAVPKYMKANMQEPSSSTVGALGTATQCVYLVNSMHAAKPVLLRYRLRYETSDGESIKEMGAATSLPAGL